MHNLATTYDRLGRFAEAEALYAQTITAKRQVQGRTHDSTVLTIRRFADMYRRAKRFSDAEHQLLPIATSLLASSNADKRSVDIVIKELAALYHEWGKSRQASEWRAKLAK